LFEWLWAGGTRAPGATVSLEHAGAGTGLGSIHEIADFEPPILMTGCSCAASDASCSIRLPANLLGLTWPGKGNAAARRHPARASIRMNCLEAALALASSVIADESVMGRPSVLEVSLFGSIRAES